MSKRILEKSISDYQAFLNGTKRMRKNTKYLFCDTVNPIRTYSDFQITQKNIIRIIEMNRYKKLNMVMGFTIEKVKK